MECYEPVEGRFTSAAARLVRKLDSTQICQVMEKLGFKMVSLFSHDVLRTTEARCPTGE